MSEQEDLDLLSTVVGMMAEARAGRVSVFIPERMWDRLRQTVAVWGWTVADRTGPRGPDEDVEVLLERSPVGPEEQRRKTLEEMRKADESFRRIVEG